MTDLVENLRLLAAYKHSDQSIGAEAADEIERLRALVTRLQNVANEAYWHLAYNWQAHLFVGAKPVDTSVFSPEARAMMTASELALLKALDTLKETER